MRKLNIALIGFGRSGCDIHGAFLRTADNDICNVKYVVEADPNRAAAAREIFGCETLSDYRELFAHVDKLDFVTRKSLAPHATRSIRRPAQEDRPFSAEEVVGEQPRPRRVDGTLCLNDSCLACVDACALSAIQYENGAVTISPELCVGCGSCESRCPCGAIRVAAGDA
jgi:NAD-dependent dihydropyrimidine dehydrogenase PreA subunit